MEDWKQNYLCGTLLILPSKEVAAKVNTLRETYDPESQAICEAHITLTQPFLCEPNEESWEQIESVLERFEPFQITYGPVETFESPIVKFDVQPRGEILQLREALHATNLFNLSLPFTEGFIPHMTITEHELQDMEAAEKLATELNDEIQPGSFPCDAIVYSKPNADFYFEIVKTIYL